MTAGLVHWWQFGDRWAWVWLVPLMAGLGLALHWIHIYLRPLHNALRLFWLTGCLGWGLLLMQAGPNEDCPKPANTIREYAEGHAA